MHIRSSILVRPLRCVSVSVALLFVWTIAASQSLQDWVAKDCADCAALMSEKTGAFILEKGEDALMGRAWLTQHAQAALGYLAPEQVRSDTHVSSRNAAVDTYGLCATIYFVFTGEHPYQGLFETEKFPEEFSRKCASSASLTARSASKRLRRLVEAGVSRVQARRPDFGEILSVRPETSCVGRIG